MKSDNKNHYDVVIIGGGAAGLSVGTVTAEAGYKTAIIEREAALGGILLQCIHNGFGLHHFNEELTGPEYAARVENAAIKAGCQIFTKTTVSDINELPDKKIAIYCSSAIYGALELTAAAVVVLAMGCRERNRGNIGIPGTRPAGIYTAGFAQRLLNIKGFIPGNKVVIIGSGDIGLIMARRLVWSGVEVKAVIEIMPHASGLPRNIAQCLEDFNIPVKTDKPLPRGLINKLLATIYAIEVELPVYAGDILVENFCDTKVNVIATRTIKNVSHEYTNKNKKC